MTPVPPDPNVSDPPEDPALSALLAEWPREPAPPGFRDAVLARIGEEAPTPAAPTAAAGSRLRRAGRFAGGVALTAAVLGGLAVLWPGGDRGEVQMAQREIAAEAPPTAAAPAARPADRAAAEQPGAEIGGDYAAMMSGGMTGGGTSFAAGDAAGFRESPNPHFFSDDSRAGGVPAGVRVVRIRTASPAANAAAAERFEAALLANGVSPLPAGGGGGPGYGGGLGGGLSDRGGPGGSDRFGVWGALGSRSGGEIAGSDGGDSRIALLAVAEPSQFDAALARFRREAGDADIGPESQDTAGRETSPAETLDRETGDWSYQVRVPIGGERLAESRAGRFGRAEADEIAESEADAAADLGDAPPADASAAKAGPPTSPAGGDGRVRVLLLFEPTPAGGDGDRTD